MEKRYLIIFRRWLWLLVLATIVASTVTYWTVKDQPRAYEANAKLLVGPGVDSTNPDLNSLRAGGQLMQTYAELIATGPFLQAVIDKLELDTNPEKLSKIIDVKSNQQTQILSITVQDRDPEKVKEIANAVAANLVSMSPSGTDSSPNLIKERMRSQATKIEETIAITEQTIRKIESDLQKIPTDRFLLNNEIEKRNSLVQQLSQERARSSDSLTALTALYDALQRTSTNQVKIIEPATTSSLVTSNARLKVLVAGMAAFFLCLVFVLGFEYLEDTIKTADELTSTTQLPILATISKRDSRQSLGPQRLIVKTQPNSAAAENYRMLGTKILSSLKVKRNQNSNLLENPDIFGTEQSELALRHSLGSMLISSIQEKDEASDVAANLAIVLAQTGLKVILVDANLHRPIISNLFGNTSLNSLSDLLSEQTQELNPEMFNWSSGLSILSSGQEISDTHSSPNPFELLASSRMVDLIKLLKDQAGIVIIYAAPFSSFADSLILASRVDAVLMVACEGKIPRKKALEVVESLRSLGARAIGIVMNYDQAENFWSAVKLASARLIWARREYSKKTSNGSSSLQVLSLSRRQKPGQIVDAQVEEDGSAH